MNCDILQDLCRLYENSSYDTFLFTVDFEFLWHNNPEGGLNYHLEDLVKIVKRIGQDQPNFKTKAYLNGDLFGFNVFKVAYEGCDFIVAEVYEDFSIKSFSDIPIIQNTIDSVISEVNSQITNMGFALDNLADIIIKNGNEKGREELNIIDSSISGIYGTLLPIADVLKYSNGVNSDCNFCISDMLGDFVETLGQILPNITIETRITPDLYVHGDEKLFKIILENFIASALEFSANLVIIQCVKGKNSGVMLFIDVSEGMDGAKGRYMEIPPTDSYDIPQTGDMLLREFCRNYEAVCDIFIPSSVEESKEKSGKFGFLFADGKAEYNLNFNAPRMFKSNSYNSRFNSLRVKLCKYYRLDRY